MGEMRFTAFKENNTQSLDIGIGIEKDCKKNLRYVLKKNLWYHPSLDRSAWRRNKSETQGQKEQTCEQHYTDSTENIQTHICEI